MPPIHLHLYLPPDGHTTAAGAIPPRVGFLRVAPDDGFAMWPAGAPGPSGDKMADPHATPSAFSEPLPPGFVPFDLDPQAFQPKPRLRQPLRDTVRLGVARAVVAASPRPVDDAAVHGVLDALEGQRPLLDWLANGGLAKFVALVLDLLTLAA